MVCLIDLIHSCHLDHLMSLRAVPKTEQPLLLPGLLVEYLFKMHDIEVYGINSIRNTETLYHEPLSQLGSI